jgi:transcriptional regulator with XRE-family HTH domain
MRRAEWAALCGALGVAIRELRSVLGWSQQALADRAVTSQGTISRLEAGTAAGVPLRSVVLVLRALAAGAVDLELVVAPAPRALLGFIQALEAGGPLRTPLEPELVRLVRAFHRLPAPQQAALAQFAEALLPAAPQEARA